jgi:hypothetical protein
MKEVVISHPRRTANGSFGGAFKTVPAYDLAKIVMQRILADAQIDGDELDDVILGNIGQPSEAANIARVSAINAGIPHHVSAYTVQRNFASGMQAIHNAFNAIQSDDGSLYLVGGTENMSAIPDVVKGARWGLKLRHTEFTDALWDGYGGEEDAPIAQMAADLRRADSRFTVERCMYPLINEAVIALQEHFASPSDIDLACVAGLGMTYGRDRKGPLAIADEIGLDGILAELEWLHGQHGERFQPARLLRNKVRAGQLGIKTGRGFHEYA